MKYCTQCGHRSDDIVKFCANCGNSFSMKTNVSVAKVVNPKNEIENDGEGDINLSLARNASQIDFDIEIPYEKMTGTSIRDIIRSP